MSANHALELLLFCFCCALFGLHCIDDSLEQLPEVQIDRPYREQPFRFTDSVSISSGLLYRKLNERGYSNIWGLAKFDFSKLMADRSFDFDPLLLKCTYEGQSIHLLISVHRSFQSVLDVFAIVPNEHEILQIYPDEQGQHISVDLVRKSDFALDRQQLFKLIIDQEGKINQE